MLKPLPRSNLGSFKLNVRECEARDDIDEEDGGEDAQY